jgi:hypothetical protein
VNTIAMPAASAATISYLAAIEIAVPLGARPSNSDDERMMHSKLQRY